MSAVDLEEIIHKITEVCDEVRQEELELTNLVRDAVNHCKEWGSAILEWKGEIMQLVACGDNIVITEVHNIPYEPLKLITNFPCAEVEYDFNSQKFWFRPVDYTEYCRIKLGGINYDR